MSLARTNKQSYAILSDVTGNAVTVSGTSLRVTLNDGLPTGTNTIGGISSVTPGTGATNLGKTYNSDFSTTHVGVAAMVVRDDGLTGTTDASYSTMRVDNSGALYTKLVSDDFGVVGTVQLGGTSTVMVTDVTPGSYSYNLGKAYDGDFSTGDVGVAALVIRDDGLTGTGDASYSSMRVDNSGALYSKLVAADDGTALIGTVNIGSTNSVDVTNISAITPSTGASSMVKAYDADFSTGDVGVAALVIRDDGLTGTGDASYSSMRVDNSGALYAKLVAADSGTTVLGTVNLSGTSEVGVNTTVSVNEVVPGTSATNLGKAVGNTAGSTDVGIAPLAIVDATLSALSQADGSYTQLRVNSMGALHTATSAAAGTGTKIMGYSDGVLYDGSFTSEMARTTYTDTSCFAMVSSTQVAFAGRAQSAGVDASIQLTMFASHTAAHGTPDTAAAEGDLYDTGIVLENLTASGGTFFGTFNDLAFPYVSFKNTSANGNDVCLNITMYTR